MGCPSSWPPCAWALPGSLHRNTRLPRPCHIRASRCHLQCRPPTLSYQVTTRPYREHMHTLRSAQVQEYIRWTNITKVMRLPT